MISIRNERLGGWPKTRHLEGILNATFFGVVRTQDRRILSVDYNTKSKTQRSFGHFLPYDSPQTPLSLI